jgi:peptide/nickel transport system ATP-binding protein/oligopeptide transport system ATP-binding protein
VGHDEEEATVTSAAETVRDIRERGARMTPLLDIRDLTVQFDTDEGVLTAVDGVALHIAEGEILGLVGESGCGKSVTALSILRLIPSPPGRIVAGRIVFRGEDLRQIPLGRLRALRGQSISMIFQEPTAAFSPLHTIGDQLVEALQFHRALSRKAAEREAVAWLAQTGLSDPEDRMRNYPFHLSGGMLQRVMIVMALIHHPALIIADEPTTALDVTIQAQILDVIRKMKDRNTSVLLITHDMGVIWELCDRVAVMYAGRIVEENTADNIFRLPQHPYTQALLCSLPLMEAAQTRLPSIPGQVPTPLEYPPGCRFFARCSKAQAQCAQQSPALQESTRGGKVACFFARE